PDADDHRARIGLADRLPVDHHVRIAVLVADVAAGEPVLAELHVGTDGGHGALGGLHAEALAGQCAGGLDGFAVVVHLVVAGADDGPHGLLAGPEVVLAAQGIRLGVDAADLPAGTRDAMAELVGRAPGLDGDVVGGI